MTQFSIENRLRALTNVQVSLITKNLIYSFFKEEEGVEKENLSDVMSQFTQLINLANQENRMELDSDFIGKLLIFFTENPKIEIDLNAQTIILNIKKITKTINTSDKFLIKHIFDLLKRKAKEGYSMFLEDSIKAISYLIINNKIGNLHESSSESSG